MVNKYIPFLRTVQNEFSFGTKGWYQSVTSHLRSIYKWITIYINEWFFKWFVKCRMLFCFLLTKWYPEFKAILVSFSFNLELSLGKVYEIINTTINTLSNDVTWLYNCWFLPLNILTKEDFLHQIILFLCKLIKTSVYPDVCNLFWKRFFSLFFGLFSFPTIL